MPLIFFFGPDGSGKTSLAKKTATALAAKGCKVRVSWMRGTHTVSYGFGRILRMHRAFQGANHQMVAVPKKMRGFWRFLEFTSVLPVLLSRFVIPSALGVWVIGERFIPDYLVWVSIVTNDNVISQSYESKTLLSLAMKANAKIYLTCDLTELNTRSREAPEFLAAQQRNYQAIAKEIHANTINTTNKTVQQSFAEVAKIVNSI
jgi:thymidylate kinase